MKAVRFAEGLGYITGALTSPAFALGSCLRRARVFHPDGVVFAATCEPATDEAALGPLAARLAGSAVVRLSEGLFRRGRELPDVLGCAIRLRGPRSAAAELAPDDQDLLFGTFRSIVTLPFAFVTTDTRNYLLNTYFSAVPYEIAGVGVVLLRLVPTVRGAGVGVNREARLENARQRGLAGFLLELRPRFLPIVPWRPLVSLRLGEPLALGSGALGFSPWQSGMGLRPYGFVQATRAVPYRLSQAARAAVESELPEGGMRRGDGRSRRDNASAPARVPLVLPSPAFEGPLRAKVSSRCGRPLRDRVFSPTRWATGPGVPGEDGREPGGESERRFRRRAGAGRPRRVRFRGESRGRGRGAGYRGGCRSSVAPTRSAVRNWWATMASATW
ncbi:MAG TPA: hypothetical protein VFS43_27580 [Polyangiaceae bacterium]|nr:hypothetical protein [Polyangiaceae bacterium]